MEDRGATGSGVASSRAVLCALKPLPATTTVSGPAPTTPDPGLAPAIAGYSLRASHPEKLAARCTAAGISVRKNGARYAAKLPAALGGHLVF